jgi:hypothetical protein
MAHAKHRTHSTREKSNDFEAQSVDEFAGVPAPPAAAEESIAGRSARMSLIVWLLCFLFLAGILLVDLAKALISSLLHG